MIIKTVKYTDLDGDEVEETLRFHLSKDELRDIDAQYDGGVKAYISGLFADNDNDDEVIKSKNAYALYVFMKDLIIAAYGEKSADARHFVKSEEIRKNFETSLAFETLMDDLVESGEYETFITGIVGMSQADYENAKRAALEDNTIPKSVKDTLKS